MKRRWLYTAKVAESTAMVLCFDLGLRSPRLLHWHGQLLENDKLYSGRHPCHRLSSSQPRIKTKPTLGGEIGVVFLAGYDRFPQCQPSNGPREIAGRAMVETIVRDEFQDDVYMLTLFADTATPETQIHVNSDGSTDLLLAIINQTLIATNGSALYKSSRPSGSTQWHIGGNSKKAVTISWDYGHKIENTGEVLLFQLGFVLTGCAWLISDYSMTYQGLKGFLADKPVTTFDVASGIERRKVATFFWSAGHCCSTIYPDIVRVYNGPTTALWLFCLLPVCAFYV
ncbi:hypothetical protein AC1031_016507 [Aphanomyces cochlioides]|nr:hypothetical protein AC1031_016507 [Aphanomyces cochlioides]